METNGDYKAQPGSQSMNSYQLDFNIKKIVLLSWRWRPLSHSRPFFQDSTSHLLRCHFSQLFCRCLCSFGDFVGILGPVVVHMWLNTNVRLRAICFCTTHSGWTTMCRCRLGSALFVVAANHRFPGSSVLIYNHRKVTGFSCAAVHLPSAQPCRQVLQITASSSILSNDPVLNQVPYRSLHVIYVSTADISLIVSGPPDATQEHSAVVYFLQERELCDSRQTRFNWLTRKWTGRSWGGRNARNIIKDWQH